jgi:hypothetical protein
VFGFVRVREKKVKKVMYISRSTVLKKGEYNNYNDLYDEKALRGLFV